MSLLEFEKKFIYGEFTLKPGESINDVVERDHVPDVLGVYLIYGKIGELLNLLTIRKRKV